MARIKIVLAGEGGHGVQSVAKILVEAAYEANKEVLYIPNFGVEQRGGVSIAFCQISDEKIGEPIGVLILCFKFEDEMERIFSKLQEGSDWLVLTILDSNGCAIATSDKYQVPIGATLDMSINETYKISKFAGKNYIVKTCATNGYQGYYGLGWYGHAMIPIEGAFDVTQHNMLDKVLNSKVIIALIAAGSVFGSLLIIKDIVIISKPGSDDEKQSLKQLENRSHAASKGGTQGVTDAIGTPGWWWWQNKK
jgi:hypothetical protein